MTPETRYAKSGDVNVAYQVTGAGPRDLLGAHHLLDQLRAALGALCGIHGFSFSVPRRGVV